MPNTTTFWWRGSARRQKTGTGSIRIMKSVAMFAAPFMLRMITIDLQLPWMVLSQAACTGMHEKIWIKICPVCQHAMVAMMPI